LEFEAACEDLFARITLPIDLALARANLTLKDIAAVELLGGGVRMPKVKKIIDGYFSSDSSNKVEVGQHLNGDEAMAMGAAFRAANLSTAFRVRKVGATDISSFAINVRLESLPSPKPSSGGGGLFGLFAKKESPTAATAAGEEAAAAWGKFTALYPAGSYLPSKMKTVAFQYHEDVSCSIEYSPDDAEHPIPDGTSSVIAVYNVTGGISTYLSTYLPTYLTNYLPHLSYHNPHNMYTIMLQHPHYHECIHDYPSTNSIHLYYIYLRSGCLR
jgi:hypoxia up-regulated 1